MSSWGRARDYTSNEGETMTFDECYRELSELLSHRGIGSDKVEGDTVFDLAKTYYFHEEETRRLNNED